MLDKMKMKVFKPDNNQIEETESWGTWSKGPSIFPWDYDDPETCYIMEGKATVTDSKGNVISFAKGDMVVFETGLDCTWRITEEIKKKYKFG